MVKELKRSFVTAIWFIVLTFPLVVIKVDYLDETIYWRWKNLIIVAIGGFIISYIWRYFLRRLENVKKKKSTPKTIKPQKVESHSAGIAGFLNSVTQSKAVIGSILAILIIIPWLVSNYQTGILITAMIYVCLGLGLNIIVGMAGLLDLGYVAPYCIGAYTYALLNHYFGLGFWVCLPIAGLFAATLGILLGIPVLRLRGDYLAIVTLGFGEIIRMVIENWDSLTNGPAGIPNIPKPGLFGIDLSFNASTIYLYYITIVFMVFTIMVIRRLHVSKIGRAWLALREDEIACQAMGVNKMKTKLTAFALGAFWAGFVGVIFAAKGSFVNPPSFTFFESALILMIVVIGGRGSIRGVILATFVVILLPEYLRFVQEYRMITFGAVMVVMMVFKPDGLISDVQHKYELVKEPEQNRDLPATQKTST